MGRVTGLQGAFTGYNSGSYIDAAVFPAICPIRENGSPRIGLVVDAGIL